jgi:hypothetical protein
MTDSDINVTHQGRGGFVEYQGYKYGIEHINEGHFCISFPSGNSHKDLQAHLDFLTAFAESRNPKWYVENRSRKYK